MITAHVFIAASLDGFIARKDHTLDWLPQEKVEGEDPGYDTFIESVEGLIMGRASFKNVLSFGDWPYQKPVIVLSKTLTDNDIPKELKNKVEISQLSPEKIMQSVQDRGWKRVYVDGGQVVQSFIRAGLIEDLIITFIPILIGDGQRLFGPVSKDINLKLINSKAFGSGMVQNQYKIIS